jgi:hypothetical protein
MKTPWTFVHHGADIVAGAVVAEGAAGEAEGAEDLLALGPAASRLHEISTYIILPSAEQRTLLTSI